MSFPPGADAFINSVLQNPDDATARLVFADWLEETGIPANTAWARYIRASIEVDRHEVGTVARGYAKDEIARYTPEIQAKLTVPVQLFLNHSRSLLQLLPALHFTASLADYEIPRNVLELMPESVARENLVIPLQLRWNSLTVALVEPENSETIEKLAFILNKDVVAVRAEADEIQSVIDNTYGLNETESVDSILVEFPDTAGPTPPPAPEGHEAPIAKLVDMLVREAISLGTQRVRITFYPHHCEIIYLIHGKWVERDSLPPRLHAMVMSRFARLRGIEDDIAKFGRASGEYRFDFHGAIYTIRVAIGDTTNCSIIDLDIADEIKIAG